MSDLIQIRRDTAALWASNNPVLAKGEIGVELDTGFMKFGSDGATAWNSLGYTGLGEWQTTANVFVASNLFKPTANAVNIFRVQQAAGTAFFDLDTTNRRVGLGTETPAFEIDLSLISASGNIVQRFVNTSNGSAIFGLRMDNWNGDIIGTLYGYSSGAAAGFADGMVYDAQRTASSFHSFRVQGTEYFKVRPTGFGYTTGVGGVISQGTDKTTAVTLNTVTGQITMNAAQLALLTIVQFTLNNTKIAAGDVLSISHVSGGTLGAYTFNHSCGANSATIQVRNATAGNLSEAIVLQFVLIKGATA